MTAKHRLADVVAVFNGRVPANTVTDPVGPRFFGIAEISGRGAGAPRYVPPDEAGDDPVRLVEGDVVMALLGKIGTVALVSAAQAGAILGRECAALRVSAPELLCSAWLCAWTTSHEFTSQLSQHVSGTTMPRLSTRSLENFAITLPSLDTQRSVEELVRRVDAAIAATTNQLQQLEALRAAELQLAMAESEARP